MRCLLGKWGGGKGVVGDFEWVGAGGNGEVKGGLGLGIRGMRYEV